MAAFNFEAKRYPTGPGCYLMRDRRGRVIYVGKAKSLRRRLSTYFRGEHKGRLKRLIERIAEIEVILVNNETESLVLENNLIKLHRPPFNRLMMQEDAYYPYIVLTGEELPRFLPFRKKRFNRQLEQVRLMARERRFGPYLSLRLRDTLLEFAPESFGLRICHPMPRRVCLRYHLGKCGGVCEGKMSPEEYTAAVESAIAFLSAQHMDWLRRMRSDMQEAAENLLFEKAQRIHNHLQVLEQVLQEQIVERDVDHDQDVVHVGEGQALIMHIRRGMLQSLELAALDETEDHTARFLLARYERNSPPEIIVNELADAVRLAETLSAANGYAVRITQPQEGEERELLRLCERNYIYRVALGTALAEGTVARPGQ